MSEYIKVYGDGSWIYNSKKSNFEEADIVVMPGGGDWNPKLYGHKPNGTRYWSEHTDNQEMNLINKSIKAGKLLFGICRGSQGVTIKAGGFLIQDVSHPSSHPVKTIDGMEYEMNSCHHQMCYPYNLPQDRYEVIAWTEELSPYHTVGHTKKLEFPKVALDENGLFKEPEVIWYPKINALCCQGHPEWLKHNTQAVDFLNKLIVEKLKK